MKKFGLLAMALSLTMFVMGCAEDTKKKPDAGGKTPTTTGTPDKGTPDKGTPHEGAEGTTGKDTPKDEAKPADAPKDEAKPADAPKDESKPADAPKDESKPADAPK